MMILPEHYTVFFELQFEKSLKNAIKMKIILTACTNLTTIQNPIKKTTTQICLFVGV